MNSGERDYSDIVDHIKDVSRVGHELQRRMGWEIAPTYAAKMADRAIAERKPEEFEFWKSVESYCTPRGA